MRHITRDAKLTSWGPLCNTADNPADRHARITSGVRSNLQYPAYKVLAVSAAFHLVL